MPGINKRISILLFYSILAFSLAKRIALAPLPVVVICREMT